MAKDQEDFKQILEKVQAAAESDVAGRGGATNKSQSDKGQQFHWKVLEQVWLACGIRGC